MGDFELRRETVFQQETSDEHSWSSASSLDRTSECLRTQRF